MFTTRIVLGVAIALVAACEGRSQTAAELAAGAAPFEQLPGVRLGMKDTELMESRPNAERLDDYLYGESIDEFEMMYVFPVPSPFGQFRIEEIGALRRYGNASLAAAAWEERIPELEQRFGTPSECVRFVRAFVEGRKMMWVRDGVEVTHGVTHERMEGGMTRPEGQEFRIVSLNLRSHADSPSFAPDFPEEGGPDETISCP